MKTGSTLAILVFMIIAIAHLLRMVYGVNMLIGNWNVPMWLSLLGIVGPAAIAWLLWRENH